MTGVKALEQTMFDNFEIKGIWWAPDNPDNQEGGILFYTEKEIHLELIGSLSDSAFSQGENKYKFIHGFSDKGEEFTLINTFAKNTVSNYPGFQTQTFSVQEFIVGGHFNSFDEIKFHALSFQPTYLTEWLGRKVFSESRVIDNESRTLSSRQVTYNQIDTFSCYVDVLKARVEETYFIDFKFHPSERILWTKKSGIKIVPEESMPLEWYQKNMNLLKDLLSLFVGHATYFENIVFYGEKEKNERSRKRYKYFFKQDKSKLKEKFMWHDVIVAFNDISQDLDMILNSWFKKQEHLEVVYDLHFGEFYKDLYIETAFLNTIQVLEIYHRKMFDGRVYDKAEYREHIKKLRVILSENFPEKFAQIIGDKVNYGNEYSLAMRIKELIFNFNETSRTLLIGTEEEINKFVRQLVDTRNYLTHYDSDNKKHLLHEPMQKYYAIQRLRAISTLILFLEVGLDEELMVNKIIDSRRYSVNLDIAKDILN